MRQALFCKDEVTSFLKYLPTYAQRCNPGSKLANNRNFDYSENTFVYYFLKEKCLEHPKALCSAIFLLA